MANRKTKMRRTRRKQSPQIAVTPAVLLAFRCKWRYAAPKGVFTGLWIEGVQQRFGMTAGSVLRKPMNEL
ncbi:MAG: hypothetical protein HND56_08710 [Pseudomonadota bacterium]|jgi:hypothetical protein|nr:hypothetical protein [Pseudomonadota bacterium]QKK05761.1 MAG: hypothetical protein HND56_08710 [Pseudomonadota bacterium]